MSFGDSSRDISLIIPLDVFSGAASCALVSKSWLPIFKLVIGLYFAARSSDGVLTTKMFYL